MPGRKSHKHDPEPTPPDGGWGWFVVMASFLTNFVAGGVCYTIGEFINKISVDFAHGKLHDTAWISSVMDGMTYGAGPVSSVLVHAYGCRVTTIIGSLLAGLGFCISYFGDDPRFFIFSIGLVAGLGFGLTYLPAIVVVSKWFGKRRAFATGLAVSGAGFGNAAFAEIVRSLLKEHGLKMTLLITGGILFSYIIFALFFASVKATPENSPMTTNGEDVDVQPPSPEPVEGESEKPHIGTQNQEKSPAEHKLPNEGVSASEATLAPAAAGNNDLIHYKVETASNTGTMFKTMRCLRLFLKPVFLIFAISNFFSTFGYMVPYTYLVDITKIMVCNGTDTTETARYDEKDAHFLLGIVGISNGVCAIVLGYISDKKCVNRLYLYNICLMLCGAAPHVASEYTLLVVCSAVFGATFGISLNLSSVICVDLLGLAELTNAYGILLVFQGAGTLIGTPIVAALHGKFCSHIPGFGLAGAFVCLSGLMLFLVPLLHKEKESNPAGSGEAVSSEQPESTRKAEIDSNSSTIPNP